jgi:hypothetical protein
MVFFHREVGATSNYFHREEIKIVAGSFLKFLVFFKRELVSHLFKMRAKIMLAHIAGALNNKEIDMYDNSTY